MQMQCNHIRKKKYSTLHCLKDECDLNVDRPTLNTTNFSKEKLLTWRGLGQARDLQ